MQCQIRKALSDSTVLCGHLEPNIVGQVLNFHPGFQDKRACSHWKITYWFVYSVLTPNDNHVHYTVIGYNIIDTHAKVRSWSSIFFYIYVCARNSLSIYIYTYVYKFIYKHVCISPHLSTSLICPYLSSASLSMLIYLYRLSASI